MPSRPPKEKLPESAAPLTEGLSSWLLPSLSSAALFAAKAENEPCPKLEAVDPNAEAGFWAVDAVAPNRPVGASALLVSSLPPLPKTEPDAGLEVEPKVLVDLEANPPNPDPPIAALELAVPVEEPNALNAEAELGCEAGVDLEANGEEPDEPNAEVLPKAEVDPNADVEPKPDEEPNAGVGVWPNAED